jgi:hypothetical protein
MHHLLIASLLSVGQPTAQLSDITIPQTISVQADSLSFKDYFGNYKMQANDQIPKIKIYYKNGSLVALAGDYPETKLSKNKMMNLRKRITELLYFLSEKMGSLLE